MTRPTVLAAGGVLWRHDATDPEVAVVHRPAYDDWSLPKGKAKPGEHLLVTAVREMAEETGYRPRIGPYLTTVRYRVTSGARSANKAVTYWSMGCVGGSFEASREVDELRWLSLRAARQLLSSASDRLVLDTFARVRRDTEPLLLVRHGATAAPARRFKPSAEPSLSRSGQEQAAALVPLLTELGVTDLISADLPACEETLRPFAASTGLTVRRAAELTRSAFVGHERDAVDAVRRSASSTDALVVCTQQGVISGLITALGHDSDVKPPAETAVRKGGWWLLHHRRGAITAYERHEPAA